MLCDTNHDAGDAKDVMVDVIQQQNVTEYACQHKFVNFHDKMLIFHAYIPMSQ